MCHTQGFDQSGEVEASLDVQFIIGERILLDETPMTL